MQKNSVYSLNSSAAKERADAENQIQQNIVKIDALIAETVELAKKNGIDISNKLPQGK